MILKRRFIAPFLLFKVKAVLAFNSLPWFEIATEKSSAYGLIVNPHYANLINPVSALGIEIASGPKEFRLGGTFIFAPSYHYLFKLTSEYLSQRNILNFISGPSSIWNEQYAFALGYAYLTNWSLLKCFNISAYQARSRDDSFQTFYDLQSDLAVLYRNIRGSLSYGASTGMTLAWKATTINMNIFFDTIQYRNHIEIGSRNGLGAGFEINQRLGHNFSVTLEDMQRTLYNQYRATINWHLFTKHQSAFQLSLAGEYTHGYLPSPEMRVSFTLSYIWNLPRICQDGSSECFEETIVNSAIRPLVRMPETFVMAEQRIVP
jgi:hypothetical protein